MDSTEAIRRKMVQEINFEPRSRETLEEEHGRVWNTQELSADFTVEGFMAPFVVVTSKTTGKKGSLMFQDRPRLYYGFRGD